jgi:hypothetical protein
VSKDEELKERKMIDLFLDDMQVNVFGLLALAAYVFIFALIIISIIRISRYFRDTGKDQKLIRIELGKVAEEVHLLRQEMKDGTVSNYSDKSV